MHLFKVLEIKKTSAPGGVRTHDIRMAIQAYQIQRILI